jgi:hypothetical protein
MRSDSTACGREIDRTAGTSLVTYLARSPNVGESLTSPERDLALRHPYAGFADLCHNVLDGAVQLEPLRATLEKLSTPWLTPSPLTWQG